MSRIEKVFETLKQQNKKALIPSITAGYPDVDVTVPLMQALVKGGADVIELGVPFSDPMADSPIIQRASEKALKNNVNLYDVFHYVREFRKENKNTPIVLMSYANPIEQIGIENFVKEAHSSNIDGVLVVDYPPEESLNLVSMMKTHNMDVIFFLASTSSEKRIKQIEKIATGYIYYVSLKGVMGSEKLDMTQVALHMSQIRKHISIPISIGFGIRDKKIAKEVAFLADGIIIGSGLIQVIENSEKKQMLHKVEEFVFDIRRALDE